VTETVEMPAELAEAVQRGELEARAADAEASVRRRAPSRQDRAQR
jgi:hypothetical protein